MKQLTSLIHKPKIAIPVAAIIFILLGIFLYPKVGKAPEVDVSLSNDVNSEIGTSDKTIDLSFPKSGRVATIIVKKGDSVQKGEVIATLSAPDALGVVSQAKGALALAEAQYASLDLNYANTKKQQDTLVENAYQTLLKTAPEATAKDDSTDSYTINFGIPTISGNYLLGKEGAITIKTYVASQGMSFTATGLVNDSNVITANPIPLGNSGLSILFPSKLAPDLTWTISIPNTKNANYAANKNAYDLALVTRDKALSELAQNIGAGNAGASVAKAQVDAARGAYEAALGAYQNNVITSPINGVVDFVDENLKVGQSISAGKTVISIRAK